MKNINNLVSVNKAKELLEVTETFLQEKEEKIDIHNDFQSRYRFYVTQPLKNEISYIINNKEYMILGDNEGNIKLFDIKNFKELKTLKEHKDNITSIVFFKENYIISSSWDGKIILWNLETDEYKIIKEYSKPINFMNITFDNKHLCIASMNKVYVIDINTNEEILIFEEHIELVKAIRVVNNKNILSEDVGGIIKIWNIENGKEIFTSYNDKYFEISIPLQIEKNYIISLIKEHEYDNKQILQIFDFKTNKDIKIFKDNIYDTVTTMKITPDKKYLILSGYYTMEYKDTSILKIIDINTLEKIRDIYISEKTISTFSITQDSKYIISGYKNGSIKIFSIEKGIEIKSFSNIYNINEIVKKIDNYICFVNKNVITLFDVYSFNEIKKFQLEKKEDTIQDFSLTNNIFIFGTWNGDLYIYNIFTDKFVIKNVNQNETAREIELYDDLNPYAKPKKVMLDSFWTITALASNNKFIFVAVEGITILNMNDRFIKVFDINTGEEIKSFENISKKFESLLVTSDNNYLISTHSNTIIQWDIKTGEIIRYFEGRGSYKNSIVISKNKYLFAQKNDNTAIGMWNIETGEEIKSFDGHTKYITSIAISDNNEYLISGSGDETVRIWDIRKNKEIKTFKSPLYKKEQDIFSFNNDEIIFCLMSRDNNYLLFVSKYSGLNIAVETGDKISNFIYFKDNNWLIYTPSGYYNCSKGAYKYFGFFEGNKYIESNQDIYKKRKKEKIIKYEDKFKKLELYINSIKEIEKELNTILLDLPENITLCLEIKDLVKKLKIQKEKLENQKKIYQPLTNEDYLKDKKECEVENKQVIETVEKKVTLKIDNILLNNHASFLDWKLRNIINFCEELNLNDNLIEIILNKLLEYMKNNNKKEMLTYKASNNLIYLLNYLKKHTTNKKIIKIINVNLREFESIKNNRNLIKNSIIILIMIIFFILIFKFIYE